MDEHKVEEREKLFGLLKQADSDLQEIIRDKVQKLKDRFTGIAGLFEREFRCKRVEVKFSGEVSKGVFF